MGTRSSHFRSGQRRSCTPRRGCIPGRKAHRLAHLARSVPRTRSPPSRPQQNTRDPQGSLRCPRRVHHSRRQIIISSDRTPREIPNLEERLRSRFEWGLIADIQPPELETKIAILRKKAEEEGAAVPEDVTMLIASRVRSNIRELEGCLIRLVFYSTLTGRSIDMQLAQEALRDQLEPSERVVTIPKIQEAVARHYSISTRELVSRNNAARVAFPRQVAMYLCKRLTASSLPEIGRHFGGKHHSTVLHSLRKIERMRAADAALSATINSLASALS